jgi:hypothetical protein
LLYPSSRVLYGRRKAIMTEATKAHGRWQVEREASDAMASSGTKITFTRKGLEVVGWFDHICATGDGWSLSWKEVDEIRNALRRAGTNSHGQST